MTCHPDKGMTEERAREIVSKELPLDAPGFEVMKWAEAKGFLVGIEYRKKQEHTEVNELKGLVEKMSTRLTEQTEKMKKLIDAANAVSFMVEALEDGTDADIVREFHEALLEEPNNFSQEKNHEV